MLEEATPRIFLLLILCISSDFSLHVASSPFFFLCHYNGQTEMTGLLAGDSVLSISVEGNPEYYEPGKVYGVTVQSTAGFDGFMMVGLYTHTNPVGMPLLRASGANANSFGTSTICSIVHSHMSGKPAKTLSFSWVAPPPGTGCVDFLVTATIGEQVVFKDTVVLHLCELGNKAIDDSSVVSLSGIYQPGIILREDFDSLFDNSTFQWYDPFVSGEISEECGQVMSGKAMVFCNHSQHLVTKPLNTTSAINLQFAVASGNCSASDSSTDVIISFATDKNCTNWQQLETINVEEESKIVLTCLPLVAKDSNVCFQWQSSSRNCWALDNIVIGDSIDLPTTLEDSFNPFDPSNWLFFPGGHIKAKCSSDGNALIFSGHKKKDRFAVTRDLNLQIVISEEDFLLKEDFRSFSGKHWEVKGGKAGAACNESAFIMSKEGVRRICSPFMNGSTFGAVHFKFMFGNINCSGLNSSPHDSPVQFYVENKSHQRTVLSETLHIREEGFNLMSYPIQAEGSVNRVCWEQMSHSGTNSDVWAIAEVALLPIVPRNITHVLQLRANFNCKDHYPSNSTLNIEFSVDYGLTWHLLHKRCLPPACLGPHSVLHSQFQSFSLKGWQRISMPLPYAALSAHSRFRFRQISVFNWAVDDVFVGYCPSACWNHGTCSQNGCRCDPGYTGAECQTTVNRLSPFPKETFSSLPTSNALQMEGHVLGYQCGVLGSGKAAVFNKDGPRQIFIRDINTTSLRKLEMRVRLGSSLTSQTCPTPSSGNEAVYVHYSCNSGLRWNLLKFLSYSQFQQPMHLSISLPYEAQKEQCSFLIWQPYHSGEDADVWAIDDLSLTQSGGNYISLNFSVSEIVNNSVYYSFGRLQDFCSSDGKALTFSDASVGDSLSALETRLLDIGPSFMLQFELVMSCLYLVQYELYLEYSTDHGQRWNLVYDACIPSKQNCAVFTTGSIYDSAEYKSWKRVTLILPSTTWSSNTVFRFRSSSLEPTAVWAIDNLFIGPQCPNLCSGHGKCVEEICMCDVGFFGKSCLPKEKLPTNVNQKFKSIDHVPNKGFYVVGAVPSKGVEGCRTMLSHSALFFSKAGVRKLETQDLNTRHSEFVQFVFQIGCGGQGACGNKTRRNESVILQYSTNGGISWNLLTELNPENHCSARLIHITLPTAARTSSTRMQWWQPHHSKDNENKWMIDGVYFDPGEKNDSEFENQNLPWPWSAATQPEFRPFCGSSVNATVVNGFYENFLVSRPLNLRHGEVVMFKIAVDCNAEFDWRDTVYLKSSDDGAVTWKDIVRICTSPFGCVQDEPFLFFSGSNWTRVLVPITEQLAEKRVMLLLQQKVDHNYGEKLLSPFATSNFYVGKPCPKHCYGHGDCTAAGCVCDPGFAGLSCEPERSNPSEMMETFDEEDSLHKYWKKLHGSSLDNGCGVLAVGKTLYFNRDGLRESETVDIDTRNIRSMTFVVRIGDVAGLLECRAPKGRFDDVLLEYTTNNGLIWTLLLGLDFRQYSTEPSAVTITLPLSARTFGTSFRFKQNYTYGVSLVQWAIDNVFLHDENSFLTGFEDDFMHEHPKYWNAIHKGFIEATCSSSDPALVFYANSEAPRIAETMDFNLSSGSFLQFDINLGCSLQVQPFFVQLEYSIDRGKEWQSITPDCVSSEALCPDFQIGSEISSQQFSNWTRISLYLPQQAKSSLVRFRWTEKSLLVTSPLWALDNVYLGDGCSWMCSGHGYCKENKCICDENYAGPHCVSNTSLPVGMKDTFDKMQVDGSLWLDVYGADISSRCGILSSGSALVFYKDGLRVAVTQDMDLTNAQYMQFTLKFGCQSYQNEKHSVTEEILVQYSNNGGITWHLLQKIQNVPSDVNHYFVIDLEEPGLHTNSTRIRLWQPKHIDSGSAEWAIDNLIIRGYNHDNPMILYDPVDVAIHPDMWLTWPGGKIDSYCSKQSSLVFLATEGEHSAYTTDVLVTENSILQFQIKVGCGEMSQFGSYPVRLEYSFDYGISWNLLIAPCVSNNFSPENVHCLSEPSVYYASPSTNWRKIVIPLRNFRICGEVRFRWYQGFFTLYDTPPVWAIDNVYVGPTCLDNCYEHGTCTDGLACQCDHGYEGPSCATSLSNPTLLKESFEDLHLNPRLWDYWNGAEISKDCGVLVSGNSLHFAGDGERILISRELDLSASSVLQFYLRLGCSSSELLLQIEPILLLYSVDIGITWHLLDFFAFDLSDVFVSNSIILELPVAARTNMTKLKFWQPSWNGSFGNDWAIDEVYVGQELYEEEMLQDDFSSSNAANWVYTPGAKIEPSCGRSNNFLHFAGQEENRYAVTTDIVMTEGSFIQFELAMGCTVSDACYNITFECSHDKGKTWKLAKKPCLPQDSWCSNYSEGSIYMSDLYYDITRITVPIKMADESVSSSTRFRWMQPSGFHVGQKWSLGKIYIGNKCPAMCSGHGSCFSGYCNCDDGWQGKACNNPKSNLPFEIQDTFASISSKHWKTISGGFLSNICGPLASEMALHFYGGCVRMLATIDMDLRNATVVQFYLRYGCINTPTLYKQDVILQYSVNGGVTWTTLRQFNYDNYLSTKYVVVLLPEEVKVNGAQLRWWQPTHQGRAQNDWALDSISIVGSLRESEFLEEISEGRSLSKNAWLAKEHVTHDYFCGSAQRVVVGQATSLEDAVLETKDIMMNDNYILQFEIAFNCEDPSWNSFSFIKLEYSRDYGAHWDLVSEQCLPSSLGCSEAILKSVFYSPLKWRRFVYFPSFHLNGLMRFRWKQSPNSQFPTLPKWAIRNIYIGPACEKNCYGNGRCCVNGCKCDDGYSGSLCEHSPKKPTYLKENFLPTLFNDSKWQQTYGGIISNPCKEMEDTAAVFSGWGPRLIETVDMDLQDAKFLQFSLLLGGSGNSLDCTAATHRNESVYLQYSTDGGIHWHLISEFDYSLEYPRREYIFLPPKARSSSTRFRWWQSTEGHQSAVSVPTWALDNVYIGGSLVCPAELYADFLNVTDIDEKLYLTANARIDKGYCQKSDEDFSVVWSGGSNIQELRTRELIIGENYMIHFKLVIGCGQVQMQCQNFSVQLEYTIKPESNVWSLVHSGCFLTTTGCPPYHYYPATIYTTDDCSEWTRFAFMLPVETYSSATQFRWIQAKTTESITWAIDDIYIGEACQDLCSGHGYCKSGKCICDSGFTGPKCVPEPEKTLVGSFGENFQKTLDSKLWAVVSGGKVGTECGPLLPHDQGSHLYFNGCRTRQAVTQLLDLTKISKLIFVLRIGSVEESASCRVRLHSPRMADKAVLLQYSVNGGILWKTLAIHSAEKFATPQKLIYEIPSEARVRGVSLKWWQPYHDGFEDQWALDNIELIVDANAFHHRY